ncbi:LLM class flavin-dependent oxidoreductase [Solicola gregarius]|uniref:TIGR03619 family F420-dependent LLM class oxidoreductase n=1 Tax=Solicola gregarius TaxID=2908642 RepID=A0AA46YKK9_9ACTN|nr:TIGR03619 family F420-dependent LLM class oxidoreductase [Solicola gregarius]UYM05880.1 TIGR03619 family F420-dependent LLM class oxidoreductase [Solicola gregarius]
MVKIGAALPVAGSDISAEGLAAVAEGAERMGLGSVWTYERLLRPTEPIPMGGPGGPVMDPPPDWANVYDPIEALTYVAAKTERILLGTSVLAALFHAPVVLARRLATLDHLSGGRLLAGVGQSWMAQEFASTGVPMRRRGAGFEEHLEVMRAVWGSNPVHYEGRFYQVPECEIGPKPVGPDGPAVLVGAAAPAAAERAGRLGLGLALVVFSWDAMRETVSTFRNAAAAAGHDPDRLPLTVQVNGAVSTDRAVDDRAPLTGAVEQVADDLVELDRLGVDHVFWAMLDPAEQLDILGQLNAAYAGRR